tara:strand:- start:374 stop:1969 length:1596 start_codon:yes stop_codon:yes gene_type:complete
MSKIPVIIDVKEKGAKKADKNIKGLSGSLGGLAKSAAMAGGAFLGAGALVSGLKAATQAAAEQELAEKKLRFAAGDLTNELIKQAEALQQNTIFGDEAIIAQQAYLASLGLTGDQIKDTISASLDLASATGMSLESAVMNTSKTLSGMAGELGEKLGPAFRELTPEALKAGEGIKFIAEQFGGTAQAEVETMTGAMAQAKNAVGDAAEALGDLLGPTIISIAKGFKGAAEAVDAYLTSLKRLSFEQAMSLESEEALSNQIERRQAELDLLNRRNNDLQKFEEGDIERKRELTFEIQSLNNRIFENSESLVKSTEDSFNFSDMLFTLGGHMSENRDIIKDTTIKNDDWLKSVKKVETGNKVLVDGEKLYAKIKTDSINTIAESAGSLTQSLTGSAKVSGRVAQAQAIIDTYAGANKAFAMGGPLGFLSAAAIIAQGLANVAQISKSLGDMNKFATGGDFVTSGPEVIMVGDNPSGRERVQITPLGGDPNINGPQGENNIVVNVSGNVMTQDFVEGDLAQAIKKATKRGVEFN